MTRRVQIKAIAFGIGAGILLALVGWLISLSIAGIRREAAGEVEFGRRSFRAGVPPQANPYTAGDNRERWLRGWVEAKESAGQ